MIAYNNEWLYNLKANKAVDEAYANKHITPAEYKAVKQTLPVGFYSPNLFIRITLFVLTVIIASLSLGLFMLMLLSALENALYLVIILTGLACYVALEIVVSNKHHYKSGVDDALIWMSAALIGGGIYAAAEPGNLVTCMLIFLIALYFSLRFADRLMTSVAFIAFAGLIFFCCSNAGGIVKALVPFILMATSAIIYFLNKKNTPLLQESLYTHCLLIVEILSLSLFYVAGNYFVVRELSNSMFNLNLQEGQSIPYGIVFKMFTAVIPVVYLWYGFKYKDIVVLRIGLLVIAASVATYKYYNSIMSIEAGLTLAGIVLTALAIFLIKYLKHSRHGFTSAAEENKQPLIDAYVESLAIAEGFSEMPAAPSGTQFGGGSFGGAGAGSDF